MRWQAAKPKGWLNQEPILLHSGKTCQLAIDWQTSDGPFPKAPEHDRM